MKYKSVLILICLVILSCTLCGCQKASSKEGVSKLNMDSIKQDWGTNVLHELWKRIKR